ncbi:MAG: serine/threonine-protein kinase, partial [Gemmataceae bacterium]
NVINILKVEKSKTNPFFVMEYFPAGSIRKRLQSRDAADKEFLKVNAKKIFKQIATGLAYMNASGYVHKDIKPDNILVNALVQTKIIDFAITRKITKKSFLSKLFSGGKKKPQGTPSYMAPEQIRDENIDGRADVYSFGATLYEITTGRPPFRGNSMADLLSKHLREKPYTPASHEKNLTDEFSNFVLKMLAKKPEDRFNGFHEILMEMKKIRVFKSDAIEDEEY